MGHTENSAQKMGKKFYSDLGKRKNPMKGFGSATPEQRREWGRKGAKVSNYNRAKLKRSISIDE